MTALHKAVKMRSNKVKVKLLLRGGANPHQDSYRGMSPVHFALMLGNEALVDVIIQMGGGKKLEKKLNNIMEIWNLDD